MPKSVQEKQIFVGKIAHLVVMVGPGLSAVGPKNFFDAKSLKEKKFGGIVRSMT